MLSAEQETLHKQPKLNVILIEAMAKYPDNEAQAVEYVMARLNREKSVFAQLCKNMLRALREVRADHPDRGPSSRKTAFCSTPTPSPASHIGSAIPGGFKNKPYHRKPRGPIAPSNISAKAYESARQVAFGDRRTSDGRLIDSLRFRELEAYIKQDSINAHIYRAILQHYRVNDQNVIVGDVVSKTKAAQFEREAEKFAKEFADGRV